ncbi:hypothetical protein [Larkinella sp.]|uniref:hypothetical protein n=1 Tax=Larkinella sp. TaxID=2034517 RepID=UPI003BAA81DD
MTVWQSIIEEQYDGDPKAFQEAWDLATLEGRLYAIDWNALSKASVTLPHFAETGRSLIEQRLGYLPHDSVILHYEPQVRILVRAYQYELMSQNEFETETDAVIKQIRNRDMRYNTGLDYDARLYENYYNYFVPYGYAVRDRLSNFLSYIPDIKHSVVAELWMRDLIARDDIRLPPCLTAADYKAITLIKYREVLLKKGKDAADQSPLVTSIL